jgi:hypothetical protein
MIAEPTRGIGERWAADDFGPALRRNGLDAEFGKMDEIGRNGQCN